MPKFSSLSQGLYATPLIVFSGLFAAYGSTSDVAIAPEQVVSSNTISSTSEQINQPEAMVLVKELNSQPLTGEITDLEGNIIDLSDPAAIEGEPVELTGRVIRAPRDLTGLWLVTVEGDGLKLVFVSADTTVGLSEVTSLVTFVNVTGSQVTNSLIVATSIEEGIGASPTELLNELIDSLLPELNSVLGDFIVSEGLDPLDEVVSGSETLARINLGLATASAGYEVRNLTGLSSLNVNSITLGTVDASDLNNVIGSASAAASTSSLSIDAGGFEPVAVFL